MDAYDYMVNSWFDPGKLQYYDDDEPPRKSKWRGNDTPHSLWWSKNHNEEEGE